MRILQQDIDHRKQGRVELIPEEDEDLWHLFNIIRKGDTVRCSTYRKHHKETMSGTVSSERVRINIILRVTNIDYEPPDLIRIAGKNIGESKYIKIGQFHTVKIHTKKKISIGKGYWDNIDIDRLKNSSDVSSKADVGALVMEEGLAHVCLISGHMTLVKQRIEMSVSKKRYQSSHEKGLERFFESILQAMLRFLNFDILKVLIVASPGFVREQFMEYLHGQQGRQEVTNLLKNKSKFLLVHSNSGHKQALKDVFKNRQVQKELEKTKCFQEVQAWEKFQKMLNEKPDQAIYGKRAILKAQESCAIDSLLLTDKLFKSMNVKERMLWVRTTEEVKKVNGEVFIFSSMHPAGEGLDRLSGVAAILRYPMPGIFDDFSGDDSDDSDNYDTEEEEKKTLKKKKKKKGRK